MKDIAIIVPNNLWYCPFVSAYTRILDEMNVEYDIISWNRDGSCETGIQYNVSLERKSRFHIYVEYQKFIKFVKNTISEKGYKKIIVSTSQPGIFLSSYLKENFKGKYIFDYRDLSIEQLLPFKFAFRTLLANSYANVISSPGFKRFLPKGFTYIQTHNIVADAIRAALNAKCHYNPPQKDDVIRILTIGGIRDYESNVEVIDGISNKRKIELSFVGKGVSADALKNYVCRSSINNVTFEGYYPKEKEKDYIMHSDFINIFYPRTNLHDAAISNRFYNSLAYRKPMIVTANTTQGDFASTYNVGLAIEDCTNLDIKIEKYLETLDTNAYEANCRNLLSHFYDEYCEFEKVVKQFILE